MVTPLTAGAALAELAALGLPVVPLCPAGHGCASPGKVPFDPSRRVHMVGWESRGVPTDDEIDQWAAAGRDFNFGLVLGRSHVRVDADGDFGRALLETWSAGDLPDTWTFTTRSGATAYLFEVPEGLALRKVEQAGPGEHEGLELLGLGQQTAIPPSEGYSWTRGRDPWTFGPAAPAPPWMVERMGSPGKPGGGSPPSGHGGDPRGRPSGRAG